jgi:hypothetical protein
VKEGKSPIMEQQQRKIRARETGTDETDKLAVNGDELGTTKSGKRKEE